MKHLLVIPEPSKEVVEFLKEELELDFIFKFCNGIPIYILRNEQES